MSLILTKLSETASKITLGWTPVPGAIGYRFQSATQAPKWSHTWDATKDRVTFSKAAWYKVEALGVEDAGEYPATTPPPDPVGDFDYLGNTFPGGNAPWNGYFNHVGHGAEDFAVSADGIAVASVMWSESGHEIRAHIEGAAVGPRSHMHERDCGRSCTITGTHIYVHYESGVRRYLRSAFMQNSAQFNDRSFGFRPEGMTVAGSELYLSDLSSIRVAPADLSGGVTRQFAASGARHLATDRQGNVWAHRGNRATRYSPTGQQLADFAVPTDTLDLAAHPLVDEVWLCDNGRDQNVKRYSYSGQLLGSFGVQFGYLAGPTPGLLGAQRFCGPRGIGFDSSGRIYVAQTGIPAVGQNAWGEMGRFLIIHCYEPDGTLRWKQEGMMFVDVGMPSPDGSRFYTREVSYTREADGRYAVRGMTLDPWTNPSDGRRIPSPNANLSETTTVRDLSGNRILSQNGYNMSGALRILRMQGEIAVPAAYITQNSIQIEGVGTESRPGSFPDFFSEDIWMDASGNVWRCGKASYIVRHRLQGFTAAGNPIYNYANSDVWNMPSQFSQTRQVEFYNGALYIGGYGPGEAPSGSENDEWVWCGRRIAKYTSIPASGGSWPSPAWNVTLHYNPTPPPESSGRDRPVGFTVNGERIAIGYQRDPNANSGYIRFRSTVDGSEVRVLRRADMPDEWGETGWLDVNRPLTSQSGWFWLEDDHLSKQVGVKEPA